MDSRIPTTSNARGEVFALGKRFPSMAAAERGVAEIISRRETIAGRTLTGRELRDGVAHKDDMSERDKAAAQQWRPTMPAPEEGEQNPFRRLREVPREPRNRKELFAKAEREYDAKLEREASDAEAAADPRRAKAKAIAEEIWEQVAFDPSATTSQVVAVEQLRRQADGDLTAFKARNEEIVASRQTKHDADVAEAEAEAARAMARLSALKPSPALDSSGLGPDETVSRWRDGRGGEEIVVLRGNVVKQKWPAAEAPADIAALAPEFN